MNHFKRVLCFTIAAMLCAAVAVPADAADDLQFLTDTLPGGFETVEPLTVYTPGNLYEYINGQAVFYLSYNFVRLEHGFYEKGESTFYVDIYELGSPLSAFGAFRQQRQDDAAVMDAGTEGAISDYLAVFYKGPYYVEILPMSSGTDDTAAMKSIARHLTGVIPGTTDIPEQVAWFPSGGLVEGSERYVDENLISYSFMGRGLVARYNPGAGEPEFRIFFSISESEEEAAEAFATYEEKLEDAESVTVGSVEGVMGSEPYRGTTMICRNGVYVLGAMNVTDREFATEILVSLMDNME